MPRATTAAYLLASVIIIEVFGLAGLAWGLGRRGRSLRTLGLGQLAGAADYALGLGIAAAYCAAAMWALPQVRTWAIDLSGLKVLAIVAAIVAGVFEETLFRGYLMDLVKRRGGGAVAQIITSGMAFGVAHLAWGFARTPVTWMIVLPALWTGVLGLALAVLYLKAKRSLGPVVVSHIAIDAIIEPGLLLAFLGHR